MLLSRKQYTNWKEIQKEYDDYRASLDFESLQDIVEYIRMDYKLTSDQAKKEVDKLNETTNETIEILP